MKKILLILLIAILMISSFASAKTPEGKPFKDIWDAIEEHDDSLRDIFVTKNVFNRTVNSILGKIHDLQEKIDDIFEINQKQDNNITALENRIAQLEERVAALENCTQGICGQPVCIPATEICGNGIDEDCDGIADDDCSNQQCIDGQTQSCFIGNPVFSGIGECRNGTMACANGLWGSCVGAVYPQPEVCDGLDNNCDGAVDENLGVTTCGMGSCERTTANCVNGALQSCAPGSPSAEICDGIDNDCDGVVDNNCIPADGTICDDANACTENDVYLNSQCVGTPKNCDDSDPCTLDSCDALTGACEYVPDSTRPNYCNGQCTDFLTDASNCGACDAMCSSNNIVAGCTGGLCTGTCNNGFADCNNDKRLDGCEINTMNSAQNCGGCARVCSTNNVAFPICSGGVCNGACEIGFADCNSNMMADGCEIDTRTDSRHCGGCAKPCILGESCANGVCVSSPI